MGILHHETKRKIFECNQGISISQNSGELVPEISALIGDVFVQFGYLMDGLAATMTTFDSTRETALSNAEFVKGATHPARIFDEFSIRQSEQAFQPNIDPNSRTKMWDHLNVKNLCLQADIPLLDRALQDNVLDFGVVGKRAMQVNAHLTDILDVELAVSELAAVTVGEFQAVESILAFKARETRTFTGLQSAKESGKALIKSSKYLLDAGGVELPESFEIIMADVAEVGPLISVEHALPDLPVSRDSLLQSGVIEIPALPQKEVKSTDLGAIRVKTIFESANHLLALLILDVTPHRCIGDMPDATDIETATPESRKSGSQRLMFFPQMPGGISFELVGKSLWGFSRISRNKQMNVIGHDFHCLNRHAESLGFLIKQSPEIYGNAVNQNATSVFGTPHEVIFQRIHPTSMGSISWISHRENI